MTSSSNEPNPTATDVIEKPVTVVHPQIPAKYAGMTRPNTVEGSKTYTYRTINETGLRVHIFFPDDFCAIDRRPAIVFFFGGGWSWGTVEQFVPQAKYLARRGMVAAVADYRVLYRDNSTPFESVEDGREAIRWIRSHAAELGIEPSHIAASGESAGALLALGAAFIDDPADCHRISARPDALILFSPPLDLVFTALNKSIRERFGEEVSDRIGSISPFQHVRNGLPPTIILNGEADQTTPYAIAEAYCSHAVANGNECRVVGYEGADHGFSNHAEFPVDNSQGGKWYYPTLLETDRFLTSIGYLQGPSTI